MLPKSEPPHPLILLLLPERQFGSWVCRNPVCVEVEDSVPGTGLVGKQLCWGKLACGVSLW